MKRDPVPAALLAAALRCRLIAMRERAKGDTARPGSADTAEECEVAIMDLAAELAGLTPEKSK